jgi:hypothetical protein
MSTNPKKFSELIIELTETWLKWMPKNKMSHSPDISYKLRREYTEECEKLINREYEIIEELDQYFENG